MALEIISHSAYSSIIPTGVLKGGIMKIIKSIVSLCSHKLSINLRLSV